jgi:hypothetical protein
MNRRSFLKTAALVATSAAVAPEVLAEGTPEYFIPFGDCHINNSGGFNHGVLTLADLQKTFEYIKLNGDFVDYVFAHPRTYHTFQDWKARV